MPKVKTHRGAAKRFSLTKSGKIKRSKAYKRDFRSLWITRINAAARLNGLSYSRMINGLKRAEVAVDRKVLADLAVNDAAAFSELASIAKAAL